MSNTAKLIINNNEIEGESESKKIISPWDSSVIGETENASSKQAGEAILSAKEAFKEWRNVSISKRIKILRKAKRLIEKDFDNCKDLLSKEIGKFPEDAASEVRRSLDYIELVISAVMHMKGKVYKGDMFEKYQRGEKTGFYTREPLGVILAIPPFNYPINLAVTKIVPALLAGNTVVVKPASQGSLSAFKFLKYFIDAGLPKGVLNIVTGRSSEIGDALVTNKDVALIAFTGSSKVGEHIREVSRGVPLLLELGGKGPAIVTYAANLDMTVRQIIQGAFSFSGQRCTGHKLVLVNDQIADEFVDRIIEKAKEVKLNPVINEDSCLRIEDFVNEAEKKGAEVCLRSERTHCQIHNPIIIDKVTKDMRVFNEEQFGPLLPIVRFSEIKEAIDMVNGIKFGLQASIYTQDIDEAFLVADSIDTGTVQINGKPDRGPDNFPFGGTKDSGQFMQATEETIKLMTRGKLVVLNRH